MMQHENSKKRNVWKGYYIALIACIAAVGISGYVFVKTARDSAVETVAPAVVASTAPSPDRTPVPGPSAAADKMEDSYEEPEDTVDTSVHWPLEGEVIATFSRDTLVYSQTMGDWRTHEGLDIAAEVGSSVGAAESGTVTAVYEDDYLGNVVLVRHSGNLTTLYAGLSDDPEVSVGEDVTAGQTLGTVGDSALGETAEPSHLHFEVFEDGKALDPLSYLPQ